MEKSIYIGDIYQNKINDILSSNLKYEEKVSLLREIVIQINTIYSLKQKEIYDIFFSIYKDFYLDNPNKINEQDIMEDVMDMIGGYYSGQNINFK